VVVLGHIDTGGLINCGGHNRSRSWAEVQKHGRNVNYNNIRSPFIDYSPINLNSSPDDHDSPAGYDHHCPTDDDSTYDHVTTDDRPAAPHFGSCRCCSELLPEDQRRQLLPGGGILQYRRTWHERYCG
jgi:hypothetical protein